MPLAAGSLLGSYEVLTLLGAGGMGDVYRARDTRLKRDVAIKVLSDSFANDSDRLARFQREAEILASLNHPHIAAIHGIEEAGSVKALVLEMVAGDTLADRVARGPIPVDEALDIARQIAHALDSAHERGVIHRDLKPANIKITPDGVVKVLDFGLAKLSESAPSISSPDLRSLSPTITSPALMTATGMILGTAAYMSPEQARGLSVDKRTDIWALGCILFEMLTGARAFPGETVSDVIASVLRSDPDYRALPPVNARLGSLLRRTLEKDARKRWRDAGDLLLELEAARSGGPEATAATATPPASRERALWILALLATATIVFAAMRFTTGALDDGRARSEAAGMVRFELTPAAGTSLYAGGWIVPFSLSPDGRFIAYTVTTDDGRSRLWLRALDAEAGQVVTGSEGATGPFWSLDSTWLGFRTNNTLYRVRVPGGSPEATSRLNSYYTGVGSNPAWGKDTILVPNGNLFRIPAQGGEAQPITTLAAGERNHIWPQFLSNGRDFIYVTWGANTKARVMRHSLDGGTPSLLAELPAISTLQYTRGHLFYIDNGVIWAQALDESAGAFVGERRRIAAGVPVAGPGAAPFSVSPSAVAYWTQSLIQQASELKWFDRAGNSTSTAAPLAVYDGFDLSRDGSRLVSAEVGKDGLGLWVHELASHGKFPLRLGTGSTVPLWAPDNRRVAYMRLGALNLIDVDDAGRGPVSLTEQSRNQLAQDWTSSGDQLLYENWSPDTRSDVLVVEPKTRRVTRLPWNTEANEFAARLSRDNQWVVYVTDQTGRPDVWIAAYPSGAHKRQISPAGGTHPTWRADGREVFYISPANQLVAMPIEPGPSGVTTGTPVNLFRIPGTIDLAAGSHNVYQPNGDGRRFLVSVKSASVDVPPISVILNWSRLLSTQ